MIIWTFLGSKGKKSTENPERETIAWGDDYHLDIDDWEIYFGYRKYGFPEVGEVTGVHGDIFQTPLHWAFLNGSGDVVEILLCNGADIQHQDVCKWL